MNSFIVKVVAATTNENTPHPLTLEVLEQLAQSIENTPVAFNFDCNRIIGNVFKWEIIDGKLHIEMNVSVDCIGYYVSIGYTKEPLKIICFGVTATVAEDSDCQAITLDDVWQG